jgi:single-stranded-DNA-specific exonuclease
MGVPVVYNVSFERCHQKRHHGSSATMTTPDFTLVQREADPVLVSKLASQGVSPLLAKLYSARGIEDAKDVQYEAANILPVDEMKNARKMGAVLTDCLVEQQRVLIISDYDCDGATAGSVLIEAVRAAGMNHGYLVPDRLKHGYGLTPSIVDEAAMLNPKPKFIITVDNGISSHAGIEKAREHGIEVLVTDHHLCPKDLPQARLIVNPQQPGDKFSSKNIAGCGVAWYVARALHDEMTRRGLDPNFNPMDLTPLVALGTVADVVILDHNNRILVSEGMKRIRAGECSPGILALANVAKRNHETLTTTDIGFALGPRINAAGRMAHMSSGIECLTSKDHDHSLVLASQLDEINKVRRELQESMVEEAAKKTQEIGSLESSEQSIVVYEPEWHEGIVGIVAGRIKDEKNRPTFVLCDSQDGHIKGSGRSIEGFHLKHALDQINIEHPGLLQKFGGHAMAAGITISADGLEEFKGALERVCKAHITPEMLERKLPHDGEIPSQNLNPEDIRDMEMQVWGQGFSAPVFVDEFKILGSRTMGEDGKHLKLTVGKDGKRLDVVAFSEGDRINNLPKALQLVFTPSINEWNGRVSVQLMSKHIFSAPGLDAQLRAEEQQAKASSEAPKKPAAKKAEPASPAALGAASSRFASMIAQQRKADAEEPPQPAVVAKPAGQPAPETSGNPEDPKPQRLKFFGRR